MLDEISFVWKAGPGAIRKTWEERFADLLKFRNAHGNCDVPTKCPNDPQLGPWVHRQRQDKRRGKLTPEHEQRLNDVGFIWDKRSA